MTEEFKEWYEKGPAIFIDKETMPESVDTLYHMHFSMSYGIYQRFFQQRYGWLIYTKPAYDKFSIHIEHGLDKEIILNRFPINNNLDSIQKILVDHAFRLAKEKRDGEQRRN